MRIAAKDATEWHLLIDVARGIVSNTGQTTRPGWHTALQPQSPGRFYRVDPEPSGPPRSPRRPPRAADLVVDPPSPPRPPSAVPSFVAPEFAADLPSPPPRRLLPPAATADLAPQPPGLSPLFGLGEGAAAPSVPPMAPLREAAPLGASSSTASVPRCSSDVWELSTTDLGAGAEHAGLTEATLGEPALKADAKDPNSGAVEIPGNAGKPLEVTEVGPTGKGVFTSETLAASVPEHDARLVVAPLPAVDATLLGAGLSSEDPTSRGTPASSPDAGGKPENPMQTSENRESGASENEEDLIGHELLAAADSAGPQSSLLASPLEMLPRNEPPIIPPPQLPGAREEAAVGAWTKTKTANGFAARTSSASDGSSQIKTLDKTPDVAARLRSWAVLFAAFDRWLTDRRKPLSSAVITEACEIVHPPPSIRPLAAAFPAFPDGVPIPDPRLPDSLVLSIPPRPPLPTERPRTPPLPGPGLPPAPPPLRPLPPSFALEPMPLRTPASALGLLERSDGPCVPTRPLLDVLSPRKESPPVGSPPPPPSRGLQGGSRGMSPALRLVPASHEPTTTKSLAAGRVVPVVSRQGVPWPSSSDGEDEPQGRGRSPEASPMLTQTALPSAAPPRVETASGETSRTAALGSLSELLRPAAKAPSWYQAARTRHVREKLSITCKYIVL